MRKSETSPADWEARKLAQSEYQSRMSKAGRDIGDIPEVLNEKRRETCHKNFQMFCELYLAESFPLNWSPDHLKVIRKIEQAVLQGELLAMAMPRGSGKTTLCEAGSLWAILYAHRKFVTIIGADEPSAEQMLDSITTELETNTLLLEDFPEVCFPISKLEGIHHRAPGQLCCGKRTRMEWSKKRVVLPTVSDPVLGGNFPTSGSILDVAGITGRLRGRKHKRADGVSIRPDLVLIDDPQTDDVARSPAQVNQRLKILNGAVLGLAGPGKKISGLCTVTVIAPGDMADQLLDSKSYPQWKGERTKLVYQMPKNTQLWEKYQELRLADLERDDGVSLATEFYIENQEAMDEGSHVAWPERKFPSEHSALQHAMNLKYQDEAAFQSEYQNDPLPVVKTGVGNLTYESLCNQFNQLDKNVCINEANFISVGIDVHLECLYFSCFASADDLTGSFVNYGSFPDQKRPYFTLRDVKYKLSDMFPGLAAEEQIQKGLEKLCDELFGIKFTRQDGSQVHINKVIIDSGYEAEAIYHFCRVSKHSRFLQAFKGLGIGASGRPMAEYPVKRGDKVGLGWRIPAKNAGAKIGVRLALADSNMWKAKLTAGLQKSRFEKGSITLFGSRPPTHDLIFDHFQAEYMIETSGRGRTVQEFKLKPGGPDNHLSDASYMALVGASMCGAGVISKSNSDVDVKKPVKFSEMQRRARDSRRR